MAELTSQQIAELRQQTRDLIMTTKPKSILLDVFGTQIELRQPNLRTIMTTQSMDDRAAAAAIMLINYSYLPGTNTKVFEDVDVDGILGLPFGSDFQKIQEAISELTDVAKVVKAEKGNLPQVE